MASQGDPTRVRAAAPPAPPPAEAGIDLTTLVLSAIASAAAAYITSKIWAPGTLFSAAMSPVIVALVKEGLRKPTAAITNVVPNVVPTPSRWTRTSASEPGLVAEPDPTAPAAGRRDPDAPHVVLPTVVPTETTTPVRVYSTRARRLRWRLAVITGLLGFGVCVVLYTVPELIAGESLGGSHKTTIFGGGTKHTNKTKTTTSTTGTTTTATTPTTTATTKTVTTTQTVTTPAPATTPTTATQTTPSSTTQTPATTTPATPDPNAAAPPAAP